MSQPYQATSFCQIPTQSLRPFYTGGPTAITKDGRYLISAMGEDAVVTDMNDGRVVKKIRGDTEELSTITLTLDSNYLILCSRSLSLRIFSCSFPTSSTSTSTSTPSIKPFKQFSTLHSSPLTLATPSPDSRFLSTSSVEGITKIWELKSGNCTHVLRGGEEGGVISSVVWNTNTSSKGDTRMELIVGSVDGVIRIWDLLKGGGNLKPKYLLRGGHFSAIRGLGITRDGKWLCSAGRDKVIGLWNFNENGKAGWKLKESLTTNEGIESLGRVEDPNLNLTENQDQDEESGIGKDYFWTGGEKGETRIWELVKDQGLKISSIQPDSSNFRFDGTMIANDKVGPTEDEEELEIQGIIGIHCCTSTALNSKGKSKNSVTLVSIHGDQNIVFRTGPNFSKSNKSSIPTLSLLKRLIGFQDQIIDLTLLAPFGLKTPSTISETENQVGPKPTETHFAIATNSNYPRVYRIGESGGHVELLRGEGIGSTEEEVRTKHKDMILCLDSSLDSKWLVSGSKDRSSMVWCARRTNRSKKGKEVEGEERVEWFCKAVAEGHSESVGAVSMAKKPLITSKANDGDTDNLEEIGSPFMITGSSDKTIKMWDLTNLAQSELSIYNNKEVQEETEKPLKLKSLLTLKIHEKDINTLDISPNNAFLISGSQDKTAKVFALTFSTSNKSKSSSAISSSRATIKQLAICSGHKRGIWSVKFSPIDAAFATSSGDKTIRLWSLKDFSCVKVFDSSSHSVLRIDFLNRGTQLLSAGAEGVVRLWNIKNEEEVWNQEIGNNGGESSGRIWGLKVVKGGRKWCVGTEDGRIEWWEDDTKEKIKEGEERKKLEVQDEQDFNNYLSISDYKNAIALALTMNQPRRLFHLFKSVSDNRPSLDEIEDQPIETAENGKTSKSKKNGKGKGKLEENQNSVNEVIGASGLLDEVLGLGLNRSTTSSSKPKSSSQTQVEDPEITNESKAANQAKKADQISITGSSSVDSILANLPKNQLIQLLLYIRDWNTTGKTCEISQMVLHAILRRKSSKEIREAFELGNKNRSEDDEEEENKENGSSEKEGGLISKLITQKNKKDGKPKVKDLGELLNGIIPYTQRHLNRADKNSTESMVLDYTLKCMDLILGEDLDEEFEEDEEEEDDSEDDDEMQVDHQQPNGKLEVESEDDESEEDSDKDAMEE